MRRSTRLAVLVALTAGLSLPAPAARAQTPSLAVFSRDLQALVDRVGPSVVQINVSGYKVWPREVEDVLYEHPAVHEAAVVGRPDDYRGEAVAAFGREQPVHFGFNPN